MVLETGYEVFYAEIVSTANAMRITIPKALMDGASLKAGDKVKVYLKKQDNESN
jgi:antitoxin component of MazEF toxin-antitoxin module